MNYFFVAILMLAPTVYAGPGCVSSHESELQLVESGLKSSKSDDQKSQDKSAVRKHDRSPAVDDLYIKRIMKRKSPTG